MVGTWDRSLQLDPSKVIFSNDAERTPTSVCSHPCMLGQIKITQQVMIENTQQVKIEVTQQGKVEMMQQKKSRIWFY